MYLTTVQVDNPFAFIHIWAEAAGTEVGLASEAVPAPAAPAKRVKKSLLRRLLSKVQLRKECQSRPRGLILKVHEHELRLCDKFRCRARLACI